MSRLSLFSHPYYQNFFSFSRQIQYFEFENYALTSLESFSSNEQEFPLFKPQFTSFFTVPVGSGDHGLNVSRVLFAFSEILFLKPSISMNRTRKAYVIKGDCTTPSRVTRFVSTYFYFFFHLKSKFVRIFYDFPTRNFKFTLLEPITFFPIVNKFFDYHDWPYSLRGCLKFPVAAPLTTRGRSYLQYVQDTFNNYFRLLVLYVCVLFYTK